MLSKIKRIINGAIKRGYWYNNVLFPDCRKFWCYNTFNTDVINLGSTSALCAFNYDGLPIKGANFALAHNPLSGDYAILRNYLGYLKPQGGVVIIPLCPFSSLASGYTINDDRYYTLLYASTIPDYSHSKDIFVNNIKKNPISVYPLIYVLKDLFFLKNKKNKCLTEMEMKQDAEEWMKSWKKEFSIRDFSVPLSLINQDALSDAVTIILNIIDCCENHGFRPVVIIPPVYSALGSLFTPEIREVLMGQLITSIKHKSVLFLDYMDDDEFCNDRTMFTNSFLMNQKGAKSFTSKVLSDIKNAE